ncbi:GtrA family protein [Sulfuricurvum sp.]|uniref:GtrA family protein n=1 Tax=Sulfuricurvum sp. TaxID=2025608 RepID=UPI00261DEFB7|nr:GtrA family protein [Sulfuricurvum sp.]
MSKHEQKIRYLIVGGWNTVFGYGVFAGLYFWLEGSVHYLVILAISYILSITNAYVGYKFFVFKTKGNIVREYFRFYVVYGTAFLVNLIVLPFLVEVGGLNMYVAQAFVTFLTIIGSYIMHKNFSFKV